MNLVQLRKCSLVSIAHCLIMTGILLFSMQATGQTGETVADKKITIRPRTLTVKNIMGQIERQTGCSFAWSRELSDVSKAITLSQSEYTLNTLLPEINSKTGLVFHLKGNIIVVKEKGKGTVSGKVTTSDGQPAGYVTVAIASHKSTLADEQGNFVLTHVDAGRQTLQVSAVGLQSKTHMVEVVDGESVSVDITLTEDNKTMQEIVVRANRNKFVNRSSDYVSRMPLKNMENSQAYTTVSKELIAEQIVTDFSNVLRNSPGVYKIQGNRGINTEGASFYTLRGFRTEASLVDGIPGQSNGEIDPSNVEKVEVIKGPSGTLYGGAVTSLGGLINIVTKKPQEEFGGNVSYTTGSFNLNRISADVYGAVDKEKTVLARLNAAYQDQSTWQDAGFKKSFFLAPAVEYRYNDKLTININAAFYSGEATSPNVIFLNRTRKFAATTPDELHFDWKRSFGSNDLAMKNPTNNFRAEITYKLSDAWTSRTNFSSNTRKSDGVYLYSFIRGAVTDTLLERNLSLQNTVNTAKNIQQLFTGDFHIGRVRNRMLIGLDVINQTINNNNSPYIVFDSVSGISVDKRYTNLNRSAVTAKLAASSAAPTKNRTTSNIYSAYVADVINVTDKLLAMLSVRVDRFESKGTWNQATNTWLANSKYDQNAISPKFGLVYQVVKDDVSLFANYMNGFTYVAPVTQPSPDISGTFKPQQANQFEAGVKLNILKNRLNLTASYYNIRVDNTTYQTTVKYNNVDYNNVTVQDGTQWSKGVEVELIASPIEQLNIIAGYAYNESMLTKAHKDLSGRRPPGAGPAQMANAWVTYTIFHGRFKGIGAGAGGNYISRHLTANSAATGVFILPEYVLLNATAFYDTKRFRLGVKFDNITDQLYFTGQGVLSPQMPFNFSANVTVKF